MVDAGTSTLEIEAKTEAVLGVTTETVIVAVAGHANAVGAGHGAVALSGVVGLDVVAVEVEGVASESSLCLILDPYLDFLCNRKPSG